MRESQVIPSEFKLIGINGTVGHFLKCFLPMIRSFLILILGWDSSDPQCVTPLCENVNCGSDGICISPEKCVCTALSASVSINTRPSSSNADVGDGMFW